MTPTLDDLQNQIAFLTQQLQAALAAQTATAAPAPPSRFTMGRCPPVPSMTLAQATFFDNGPSGSRKKHTAEFAVTVETWIVPPDQIKLSAWQWKKSIPLIEYDTFKLRFDGLLNRGSITPEYHEILQHTWKKLEPQIGATNRAMFGLISTKNPGTVYFDNQFAIVYVENRIPTSFQLLIEGDDLFTAKFDHLDMKGQPLKGYAKRQARLAMCDFHSNWSTE
ncbi:hypothetical protein ACFZ8E_07410 [Methylobacterium sp. HMF5984]|uniref:hypothetical protein n=1 Tax=Methylobacterium sp. HMF5984 TaxID=3367370 RepID=UPI00385277BE